MTTKEKNQGGAPVGIPKSPLSSLTSKIRRDTLEPALETIRQSINFPREKKQLKIALERGDISKEQYDERLIELEPDSKSLATAKWAVEKYVAFHSAAQADVRSRQNIHKVAKELGKIHDEDDGDKETAEQPRFQLTSIS